MPFQALVCPHCGGPLPPNAKRSTVVCAYCGVSVAFEQPIVRAADYRRILEQSQANHAAAVPASSRVWLAGVPYHLLGRVAQGESTDVLLAQRAHRITELCLVKVLRAACDLDLLTREWDVLGALAESNAQGAAHFSQRLPQPVARAMLRDAAGASRHAIALRHPSGFVDTLEDVRAAYPAGVDPRHVVWMWRRILELVGWVHRSGFIHGAILPQHLLVHARDHGVQLVGWSCAVRRHPPERAVAWSPAHETFYPAGVLQGAALTALADLTMSARCMAYALGAGTDHRLPPSVPASIARLIDAYANPRAGSPLADDAWELERAVAAAAREAFGPPKYHVLNLPSWG